MRKQHLFPQDCLEKQEAYERLCRDRRSRCSADSQSRKGSDSKDQPGTHHNIEDKPRHIDDKRCPAVSRRRQKSCQDRI